MIFKATRDEKLPIYGDGLNIRDWIYVFDHCRAIDFVIQKGNLGEVYNIGGDNEKHNIDVVKIILDKLGKSYDLIQFVQDRPGHDRRYAIDISKIKKELGWTPEYSFERGIEETIKWYQDNKIWVNNCVSGDYMQYYERNYAKRDQ